MTRERTSSTSEPASLEVLHQNVHLPKQVAQLALHRLPLQQERPDREQLIVAGHTLAVPFFSGNVDSHTRRCRNVCLDDRTEIFEDNPQTGTPGRHVRLVFALKQIVDDWQYYLAHIKGPNLRP